MKKLNIIKVDMKQPKPEVVNVTPPPPIPDLVLNFASHEKVYTLWVPSGEMGKVAKMFCDLMDQHKIVFKLEERSR